MTGDPEVPRRTRWAKKKPAEKPPEPEAKVAEDLPPKRGQPRGDDAEDTGSPGDLNVLPPGKPIPLVMMEGSEAATLNNLIAREVAAPTGQEIEPSPTVRLLVETVSAISRGQDITPFKEALDRIVENQAEKTDLILAQLSQIDDERIAALTEIQERSERLLRQACRRGDITVGEMLATWRLTGSELATLRQSKQKQRTSGIDGASAINKLQERNSSATEKLAAKWEYTTPQGREIIRKRLWELNRNVQREKAAEVEAATTTTTTDQPKTSEAATP